MKISKYVALANWTTQDDIRFIQGGFGHGEYVRIIGNADNLDDVDLLFLTGGSDVDPMRYGGDASKCGTPDFERDIWDQKYIPEALERNIPIFGICRGSQTLWVSLGGKLIEEIWPMHGKGFITSKMHRLDGPWGCIAVNSFHHQGAYGETSQGAVPQLFAKDGIVEAFTYKNNVCGVQWHPEWMQHRDYIHLLQATIHSNLENVQPMFNL